MNILILNLTALVVFTTILESHAQECDCDCEGIDDTEVYATFPQFSNKHVVWPNNTPTTMLGWNDLLSQRCPRDFIRPNGRLRNSFIDGKTITEVELDIKNSLNRYDAAYRCNNQAAHGCVWSINKHRIIQMVKIPNSPNPRVQYDIYVCTDKYFIAERNGISQPNHFEGYSTVATGEKEQNDGEGPNCRMLS